ncbi:MAG TPA: GAF and ANTAR domain-containing protein [Mycobacteriales bacterium]|nr:GAF and ANTAR domain-containing protein [Mycobacteriales bacterium]
MGRDPLGSSADLTVDVAANLAAIAGILLSPSTVTETLSRVVTYAVATIDGCDEAGMCLRPSERAGAPGTPLLLELDDLQTSLGEGPCLDALAGQDSIYVADLLNDPTWPRFGAAAVSAGLRSALAYRLFVGPETLGAFQLFARLPAAFNATDRAQGLLFAAHAAMALQVARSTELQEQRAEHLQAAMASREVIGQAQGILMERERITADQAFQLLRHSSQHLNLKLRDVAQTLVDTGTVPASARD